MNIDFFRREKGVFIWAGIDEPTCPLGRAIEIFFLHKWRQNFLLFIISRFLGDMYSLLLCQITSIIIANLAMNLIILEPKHTSCGHTCRSKDWPESGQEFF